MSDDSLRLVYKAVVLSKLYSSRVVLPVRPTSDVSKQLYIRRAIRLGLSYDLLRRLNSLKTWMSIFLRTYWTILVMFIVLYSLLPSNTKHTYNLRPRRHSLPLTVKTNCKNFINRLLLKGHLLASFHLLMVAFCQLCIIKEINDGDDGYNMVQKYSRKIIPLSRVHALHRRQTDKRICDSISQT